MHIVHLSIALWAATALALTNAPPGSLNLHSDLRVRSAIPVPNADKKGNDDHKLPPDNGDARQNSTGEPCPEWVWTGFPDDTCVGADPTEVVSGTGPIDCMAVNGPPGKGHQFHSGGVWHLEAYTSNDCKIHSDDDLMGDIPLPGDPPNACYSNADHGVFSIRVRFEGEATCIPK